MTRWEKIESIRKKYYGKYARKFKRALKNQVKPVFEYIDQYGPQGLEFNLDKIIQEDEIKEMYIDMYKDIGLRFRQEAHKNFAKKDLQDTLWETEIENYVRNYSFEKITWISNTTRDIILNKYKSILQKTIDEGQSITSLKKQIINDLKKEFNKTADWRALRIAHTEVMTASNTATHMAENEITIPVRKIWITAVYGVARTKERHTLMGLEDQKPMKGQPFNVDGVMMQYPGDPNGGAENVINCRCALAYEPIELN